MIHTLDHYIDEADGQLEITTRGFLSVIDGLIEVHEDRLLGIEKVRCHVRQHLELHASRVSTAQNFKEEVATLEEEFITERSDMMKQHSETVSEMDCTHELRIMQWDTEIKNESPKACPNHEHVNNLRELKSFLFFCYCPSVSSPA